LFTAHMAGGLLPPPLSQAFPLLVAGCAPPFPPSPASSGLFIYSSGRDSPAPPFGTQCAPPSLLRVFIVLIAYYSVSLFSPGGGRSVQGAMLIWSRDVCGSTAHHLGHLVVHVFPSHLGAGDWRRPGGPPGFSKFYFLFFMLLIVFVVIYLMVVVYRMMMCYTCVFLHQDLS
jgi:hypothetical protein